MMCEPQFYDERLVRARKSHKCCETGRMIQPGEKYWRIVGNWEGDFSTFAQSEAAFHFARYINGVGEGTNAGSMRNYSPDSCIPFGHIGGNLSNEPDVQAEWERVCRGEVTRNTVGAQKGGG